MADVPARAELVRADGSWPVVAVKNVYVLPGVPEIFRRKFLSIRDRFRSEPFWLRQIYLDADEGAIASALDEVQTSFPEVAIGSYPKFDPTGYRIKVTLESKQGDAVERATRALLDRLPAALVIRTE
jgi:molybdopterin-biosynthesis enzyme MoeA-like protein